MGWAQGHPFSRPRSRRPDLLGLDAVALHLEVQSLVVDPQEARRLTLVPPRGLKSHADRLPLRLGGGPVGDILQGGARLHPNASHQVAAVPSHRTVETPAILGPVTTVPPERRRRGHLWPRGSAPALAGMLEVWREHPGDEARVMWGRCGRASRVPFKGTRDKNDALPLRQVQAARR